MKRVFGALLAVCLLTGCAPSMQEASAPVPTAAPAHTLMQPKPEPISSPAAEFEPETSPDPAYPYALTGSRYAACFQPNEVELNGDGLTDTWRMLKTDGYFEGIEIEMGGSGEKRILSRSEELEDPMELTACVTGDFTADAAIA